MIFYASALSSYSAKVRLVLCVKNVAFTECVPPGGYRSAQYRAIAPMGSLPAIRVGDWVLSESEAINEFLEERYPEPAMLPHDLQQRAQVRFLCRFHDLYLEPTVRALFGHVNPASRNPERVGQARQEIEHRLQQLAQWSAPEPYLLTPQISLADCGPLVTIPLAMQVLATCGEHLQLPVSLRDWLHAADQHPAVERALAPWRVATAAWLNS